MFCCAVGMQVEITLCSARSIKERKRDNVEGLSNKVKLNGTDKSSKPPYSNSKHLLDPLPLQKLALGDVTMQ